MEVRDAALQNPWWANPKAIEEDAKVKESLAKKPVLSRPLDIKRNAIILGPRQVGKTTSLKLLIRNLIHEGANPRNILYFSCEPVSDKKELIDLVTSFSDAVQGRKYIFLDEVTQVKQWELAVKYILETALSKDTLLVATGSNALLLKKGSEMLPGRDVETWLFLPLSFRESLLKFGSDGLKAALEANACKDLGDLEGIRKSAAAVLPFTGELKSKLLLFLKAGGYPKPLYELMETGGIREETYEIYVKWILGDLNKLDRRESTFKSMAQGVIKNYGTKFSLHSFAKGMDIPSHVTVSDYLDIMQALLLTNNLYQVDLPKKLPVFRKERKCYFLDPFLYSVFKGYLLGRHQDYSEGFEAGLLEGVVCEALSRRVRKYLDTSNSVWFYSGKKETDFAVREGETLVGIELKWQNKAGAQDFQNVRQFRRAILLSKDSLALEGNVLTIPAQILLALL